MNRRHLAILSIGLLAAMNAAAADLAKRSQIAVMPLSAPALDSSSVATIENALGTELLRTEKVRVLERAQMQRILKEQGFQKSGTCDQTDCNVEMGKLLAVDKLLVGSLGQIGNTYSLTLRLVDVGSGEVLGSSTRNQKGAIDDVLTQLLPLSVGDLLHDKNAAPVPPPPPEKKSSLWPWIAGGVVVAGGAAAAVLLTQGKSSSTATTSNPPTGGNTGTSVVEFTVP